MTCRNFYFNQRDNVTAILSLNQSLSVAISGDISSAIDSQDQADLVFASLYCAVAGAADISTCFGICPNPDIAGIGVRLSFWIQSFLNAILVLKSPKDSDLASWSATMLTTAVVIPAIIQKSQQALTLYHAVQVLNFATFSSVTSLAVAPLCHIWRQTGEGKVAETLSQFDGDAGFDGGVLLDEDEDDPQVRIRKLQEGQIQISRVVLSGALIIQICLQWTWAIILFTDTTYAQAPCSDLTLLYFFGIPLHASDINHGSYYIFPLWLLFNMCISLFWGILLVITSNPDMHPVLSRAQTELDPESAISGVINNITKFGIPYRDRKRMLLLGVNVLAVIVAAFILITSELEAWKNCILLGENTTWGFGQITAILLSLTPGGSLVVAVYDKHIVHERKRQELRRISEANSNPLSSEASFTMSPADSPLIRLQRASAVHFPSSTSHSSTLEPPGSHAPTNALGLSAYESYNAANPTVLRPALEDVFRARPKRRLSASSHSSNHLLPT